MRGARFSPASACSLCQALYIRAKLTRAKTLHQRAPECALQTQLRCSFSYQKLIIFIRRLMRESWCRCCCGGCVNFHPAVTCLLMKRRVRARQTPALFFFPPGRWVRTCEWIRPVAFTVIIIRLDTSCTRRETVSRKVPWIEEWITALKWRARCNKVMHTHKWAIMTRQHSTSGLEFAKPCVLLYTGWDTGRPGEWAPKPFLSLSLSWRCWCRKAASSHCHCQQTYCAGVKWITTRPIGEKLRLLFWPGVRLHHQRTASHLMRNL